MKRIIYSLVLMFAIGGFFTSCIDNVEPEGVKEMRLKHAKYLEACSTLKLAEAKVMEAHAVYRQAEADAIVAKTELQRILNKIEECNLAIKKAKSETEIAAAQAAKDAVLKAWEIQKLKDQENLAKAKADLEKALREIEVEKLELTAKEKAAINRIKAAYQTAVGEYQEALEDYNDAVADKIQAVATMDLTKEDAIAVLKDKIAFYEARKEGVKKSIEVWNMMKTKYVSEWVKEIDKVRDSIEKLLPDITKLKADSVYFMATEEPVLARQRDKEIAAANAAYDEAIEALGPRPETKNLPKDSLQKKYVLPLDKGANDIITVFESFVNNGLAYSDPSVKYKGVPHVSAKNGAGNIDTLHLYAMPASEKRDSIFNAAATAEVLGLNTLVTALEKPYIYDMMNDVPTIAAAKHYKDSIINLYNEVLARMAPVTNFATKYNALFDAWNTEVRAPYERAKSLQDSAKKYGDLATTPVRDNKALATHTTNSHSNRAANYFTVGVAVAPGEGYVAGCSQEDSVKVINSIKEYYAALKVILPALNDSLDYVRINTVTGLDEAKKVAMQDVTLNGFKLQSVGVSPFFGGSNILMVSDYDNKGRIGAAAVSEDRYIDALYTYVNKFNTSPNGSVYDVTGIIPPAIDPMDHTSWAPLNVDTAPASAKALYRWLMDCYIYYGEEGHHNTPHSKFGAHYLGFEKETFEGMIYYSNLTPVYDATNVNIINVTAPVMVPENGEANVVKQMVIVNNSANLISTAPWDWAQFGNTLVFKLLASEAFHTKVSDGTINERWTALKAIIKEMSDDFDAVAKKIADAKVANAAIIAAQKAWDAEKAKIVKIKSNATTAANKKYKDAVDKVMDPINDQLEALYNKKNELKALKDGLVAVYEDAMALNLGGTVLPEDYNLGGEGAFVLPTNDVEQISFKIAYHIYMLKKKLVKYDEVLAEAKAELTLINDENYVANMMKVFDSEIARAKAILDASEYWMTFYKGKFEEMLKFYGKQAK